MIQSLLILLLTWPCVVYAANHSPFYKLSRPHQQSVLFKRLSDGKVIYASNPEQTLSPASVSKLIVAAAALSKFTPAHKFKTKVYIDGHRQGGKIKGNLYFLGSGDPYLINEKLWQFAADLKHMGITEITGDIVIDDTVFDDIDFDPSRIYSKKRSSNAYNAPVSGFGVNFNTFPIAIAPGNKPNQRALVSIDPYPIRGIKLNNKIQTTSGGRKSIRVTRSTHKEFETVSARGTIPIKNQLVKVYRAVSNPTISSGEIIRSFLQEVGIRGLQKVREGKIPTNATLLYEIESYEMSKIISGLNKYSNNYIADVLLKNLGAHFSNSKTRTRGSFANGLEVIKSYLNKDVKTSPGFSLHNASGLDPRNRLSATQVVDVLSDIFKRMDVFPEFLASLPAAGWDGTLEDRFRKARLRNLKGQIRAKTGSLTNPVVVSSLAGYMGHPEHGMIAFAIIENGINKKQQPSILDFRARQELALQKIVESF